MQGFFVGVFAILCIALGVHGQVAPIPFSFKALVSAPALTSEDKACGAGDISVFKCLNCNKMQFCDKSGKKQYEMPCSAFPGKSYCRSGKTTFNEICSDTPDTKLCTTEITEKSNCPGVGLYPSLANCKDYYLCSAEGDKGMKFTCMGSYNYNHGIRFCKLNSPCAKKTCGTGYQLAAYDQDDSLYIICRGDLKPILKECEDNMAFNSTTFMCEFKCRSQGFFKDPANKKAFYVCQSDGKTGFIETSHKCDVGQEFDDDVKHCIISTPEPEAATSPP